MEIRKLRLGFSVFVTDVNGTPVRFPLRISDF